MIEVQVAFAMLGIGLAGLCPLVVTQLRQVRVPTEPAVAGAGEPSEPRYRREPNHARGQDLLYRAVAEPLDAEAGRQRPSPGLEHQSL